MPDYRLCKPSLRQQGWGSDTFWLRLEHLKTLAYILAGKHNSPCRVWHHGVTLRTAEKVFTM